MTMLGTEKPVQDKIVRDLATIGWTPVRQKAMNELRRGRMGEAIVEPRVDVACLVNGLPLGLIETKAFNEDWKEAVSDFEGYWVDAPDLERFGAVCVATNGFRFRCAPTGARGASSYAEWKDTWPQA